MFKQHDVRTIPLRVPFEFEEANRTVNMLQALISENYGKLGNVRSMTMIDGIQWKWPNWGVFHFQKSWKLQLVMGLVN